MHTGMVDFVAGGCYDSITVSGAEAVQASRMGTFTKLGWLTQGDRPVCQSTTPSLGTSDSEPFSAATNSPLQLRAQVFMTLECLRLWKFITPDGRSVYNFGFYVKGPTV